METRDLPWKHVTNHDTAKASCKHWRGAKLRGKFLIDKQQQHCHTSKTLAAKRYLLKCTNVDFDRCHCAVIELFVNYNFYCISLRSEVQRASFNGI